MVSGGVTIENNTFIMPFQPVTVRAVFDRNSSGPTRYAVTVPDDIEGGTVKASPTRASRGQTVTITVKPDEGCVLDEIAVYDADGDALELERANANQYQFTMPRGKVEIEVSFRELPPEPLPFRDVPAGHWAETAIRYVWENGLMAGTGETAFGPDDPLTRGQLVTIPLAGGGQSPGGLPDGLLRRGPPPPGTARPSAGPAPRASRAATAAACSVRTPPSQGSSCA